MFWIFSVCFVSALVLAAFSAFDLQVDCSCYMNSYSYDLRFVLNLGNLSVLAVSCVFAPNSDSPPFESSFSGRDSGMINKRSIEKFKFL